VLRRMKIGPVRKRATAGGRLRALRGEAQKKAYSATKR
jgi:hypothetical protein